jgi:hypothetical protein
VFKRFVLTVIAWALEGVDAAAQAISCEPVAMWANESWAAVVAKLDQVVNAPP